MPRGFRGRSAFYVQIWWLVQGSLFRWSPQFAYRWRASLLRLFGAAVGNGTIIRQSVRITYPWKVKIGDNVWIGDRTELYSLGSITIGASTCISQDSYICTGTHDPCSRSFEIYSLPIEIGTEVWINSGVFVMPGTKIGSKSIIGVRSLVMSDIPEGVFAAGSPATVRGPHPGL